MFDLFVKKSTKIREFFAICSVYVFLEMDGLDLDDENEVAKLKVKLEIGKITFSRK